MITRACSATLALLIGVGAPTLSAQDNDSRPEQYQWLIHELVDEIARRSNTRIECAPEVQGSIVLRLKYLPWRAALDAAAQTLGYRVVRKTDGVLRVVTIDTVELVATFVRFQPDAGSKPDTSKPWFAKLPPLPRVPALRMNLRGITDDMIVADDRSIGPFAESDPEQASFAALPTIVSNLNAKQSPVVWRRIRSDPRCAIHRLPKRFLETDRPVTLPLPIRSARHGGAKLRILRDTTPNQQMHLQVSRTDAFAGPILPDLTEADHRSAIRILPRTYLRLRPGHTHVVDLGQDPANPMHRCWVLLSTRKPDWRPKADRRPDPAPAPQAPIPRKNSR